MKPTAPTPAAQPATYTVADLARLIGCTERTVFRLRDRGDMPRPLRGTGRLLRWSKALVDDWLAGNLEALRRGRR